jgi:hypothetical protein
MAEGSASQGGGKAEELVPAGFSGGETAFLVTEALTGDVRGFSSGETAFLVTEALTGDVRGFGGAVSTPPRTALESSCGSND